MSPRPAIFISAVSTELRSARQLVANTLTFLGYEPEWQDIFGTGEGDLRAMLRRRIDSCKGVIQLVGQCYGAEPLSPDEKFGRVSYTQYEALYAQGKGKRVWYLFLDERFLSDPHEDEDEERRKLQGEYRARLKAESHLYHPLSTSEAIEAGVLKLRDDLTQLRRGVQRWAAFVAVVLLLIVALTAWLLQTQQHSNQQLQTLEEKFDKLQQGVNSFAEVQNKVRQEQPGQKTDEIEQRTYEELGKELGLDPGLLKTQLPRLAQELKKAPNATTYERANGAYVDKDYNEAERLALAAADEALKSTPPRNADAIKAFELAGWAADKRVEYADALKRLRDAEKLTNRARDPVVWARVQFAIGRILDDQGQYADEERVLRDVLKEREHALGPEAPDTLTTRNLLANALRLQDKFAEAETECRAVIQLRAKVLGPEHPDTLQTRNILAAVLAEQGKYAEAEAENRAVLTIREKVLGSEHPDTLITRNNLANVLYLEGKYQEAETEYRAVIRLEEKVKGPNHPDTLRARGNLANALWDVGKYAEAEAENREVLRLREMVLGPQHPDTLASRNNLADLLDCEGKYAEAEAENRGLIKIEQKLMGPEHPDTLENRNNLAEVLDHEGKYGDAETEYRAVLELEEKVLGPEHPHTLITGDSLAQTLDHEAKYAAAEAEYRTVLKLRDKVLGSEHPDTLKTCSNLAVCLRSEGQTQEATAFAQRAADGARKVLGPQHPDTKKYEQLVQELLAKEG
jgi:tetratricopeptide (TPR) repeat protein